MSNMDNFVHTYHCRKTGQTVDVEWAKLPDASREYFARKGIGEYFDNYHASKTVKALGAEECAKVVRPMVDEAYTRMMAGDMPGARVPSDPATIERRKMAETLKAEGVGIDEFTQWLAARRSATGDSTTAVAPDSTLIPAPVEPAPVEPAPAPAAESPRRGRNKAA